MLNTVVPSVGSDMTNPGMFYWDIKTAALDLVYVRKGFKTLEEAKASLQKFRDDLTKAVVIVNC